MEETWPCELKTPMDLPSVEVGVLGKEEENGEAGIVESPTTRKSSEK